MLAQGPGPATTSAGWRLAEPGYTLQFPRDHGSHPEYRIEWWYYTGNLATADGRRFGYQVTFFRIGVDPAPVNPSRWAVRDLHMAHLAVTDVSAEQHLTAERFDRGGGSRSTARLIACRRSTTGSASTCVSNLGSLRPLMATPASAEKAPNLATPRTTTR